MATTLYILTGITQSTTPSMGGSCSGPQVDTIDTYSAVIYDEFSNPTTAPITINFDITGVTTPSNIFINNLEIPVGNFSGSESIIVSSFDDDCSSPGNCVCETTESVTYFELITSDPNYIFLVVDTIPTPSPTPTITSGYLVQFVDCSNNNNVFRFSNLSTQLPIGLTYNITNSDEFLGCATVIDDDGSGSLYDGNGVILTQTANGCGDIVCPRTSIRAALLSKCDNGEVFYGMVEDDTSFVGATYHYNNECYSFVEFSGPGGPNLGSPDYDDCQSCLSFPTPTPTRAPSPTPSNTPTPSVTPLGCNTNEFCFRTTLPSLSGYSGNYIAGDEYNGRLTYSGDGINLGVIYYYIGDNSYWCLSDTLGGTCYLKGASPCKSQCPDIAANDFYSGICPTPTPAPADCSVFNFNAYFDCDWEPFPTPTPSIPCEDVNFTFETMSVTPTPSPANESCDFVAVSFSMSGYTPPTPPTTTPTNTPTNYIPVDIQGIVTYGMLEESFSCVSVKVLIDCQSGEEYYITDNLSFNGIPIVIGITLLANINGENRCVTYVRDDSDFSSNSTVGVILEIYSDCEYCSTAPTPTPTPTNTQTPTLTNTQTPTPSITPSPSSTIGGTPQPYPTSTPTNTPTPTNTQTPSSTPNYVYVYESCFPIGTNASNTQIIQTQVVPFANQLGVIFKDLQGNCWTYIGRFESTYIAPISVFTVTFEGNYFDGSNSLTYETCQDCQTVIAAECEYIYFNANKCDGSGSVVVYACDFGPTNDELSFGSIGGSGFGDLNIPLTPSVGQTHVVSDTSGNMFCVTLTSIVPSGPETFLVQTPAWSSFNCSTCPIYKTYYVNACDGTEQNVLVYAPVNSTTLTVGQVIGVTTNNQCYSVISYEGLMINSYFIPGSTPEVSVTFTDCQTCININNQSDFSGGGDGGKSIEILDNFDGINDVTVEQII